MSQEPQIICVTTETVHGRRVKAVLGVVWGVSQTAFQKIATRELAYDNLVERAKSLGADAVISIRTDSFSRFDYDHVYTEYVFYGTAVKLE